MLSEYAKRITSSRVYELAHKTDLLALQQLEGRLQNTILLKREDQQISFSFKVRGAYNKMAHLSREQLSQGVIASSAGNHAQGVALAAAKLGCHATIVMPVTTPQVKIDAVRGYGKKWVKIEVHGESYSDAHARASEIEEQTGKTFIHPFDDPLVVAGQGTIGKEILDQYPETIDAIFVAVGGGGLIAGIGAFVKSIRPDIRLIGVQAEGSTAMTQSLNQDQAVVLEQVSLFSDGTAVKQVGSQTLALCREVVDEMITVSSDEICAAISDVYIDTRSILEPAGALSLAGLKKWTRQTGCTGKTLVSVACGANMNFNRLRHVSERAEVGRHKEALFAITIQEERGAFRDLCELIGNHSVTEFNYRISDQREAHILVGLNTHGIEDGLALESQFNSAGLKTINLSGDEMAKTHLRHMVGGKSAHAEDELLYRFEFPERPGALMSFLSNIPSKWNISLFHYRATGSDYGDVLVGIQGTSGHPKRLESYLEKVGFRYRSESDNPAYRLFLSS